MAKIGSELAEAVKRLELAAVTEKALSLRLDAAELAGMHAHLETVADGAGNPSMYKYIRHIVQTEITFTNQLADMCEAAVKEMRDAQNSSDSAANVPAAKPVEPTGSAENGG